MSLAARSEEKWMFSQASHWYACKVELEPSITALFLATSVSSVSQVALTGLLVLYKNLAQVTATQGKMFTRLKSL